MCHVRTAHRDGYPSHFYDVIELSQQILWLYHKLGYHHHQYQLWTRRIKKKKKNVRKIKKESKWENRWWCLWGPSWSSTRFGHLQWAMGKRPERRCAAYCSNGIKCAQCGGQWFDQFHFDIMNELPDRRKKKRNETKSEQPLNKICPHSYRHKYIRFSINKIQPILQSHAVIQCVWDADTRTISFYNIRIVYIIWIKQKQCV